MTNLPGNTQNPVDGIFVIVKNSDGQFKLGVPSVAPGATISFLNSDDFEPCFLNGNSPFNPQTTIIANTASGTYPFTMVLKNNPPAVGHFPYIIHVVSNGNRDAVLRVVDDDLRVVVPAHRRHDGSLNIEFVKEDFQDLVNLTYRKDGRLLVSTIPQEQPKGYWSDLEATSERVTFTMKNKSNPLVNLYGSHCQVVGGDAGDLDILPPEGL